MVIHLRKTFYTLGSLFLLSALVITSYLFFFQSPLQGNEQVEKEIQPEPSNVKIAAFGDLMMHSPQINGGLQPDGTYNFDHFFQEIHPYFTAADLTIGNFETTMVGSEREYAGYPMFNSPDAIADALKKAGVDLLSTANNHSMDTGVNGVKRTYEVLKDKGIEPVGTAPTPEERKPTILEKNSIRFAFLAYTEHTNGLPVPQDQPYLVNLIDSEQIKEDIQESKNEGAEFIIVSLHFGNEYEREPNETQIQIANQALQDGADVILGSHPHVVQRMEQVQVGEKDKLIVYSMGNFVSNQFFPYTDEGVVVFFDVEKDPETNTVRLKEASYLPTFVHKYPKDGLSQYVVIPMDQEQPDVIPDYPQIDASKWTAAWTNTVEQMKKTGEFPTFSLQSP